MLDGSSAPFESPGVLAMDRFIFIGSLLGGMAYELLAITAFRCIRALWVRRQSFLATASYNSSEKRQNMISLFLVLTMLTLGTINFGAQVVWTVQAFVDNRSFPAGSAQWMKQTAGYAPSQISNICCIIATFLSDGILLWRAFVIWNRSFRIMAVPIILFNAVSAMSIIYIYGTSHTNQAPFDSNVIYVIYGILLITSNLILTTMIVGRLLFFSWYSKRALWNESTRSYTSAATIVIESALPYTVATATFVIVYSQSDTASQGLFPLVTQIIMLSPLLIIWRVAKGKAVSGTSTSAGNPSAIRASTRIDWHARIEPGVPLHNLRNTATSSQGLCNGETTEDSPTNVEYADAKLTGTRRHDV